jgi:hypothetical protein
MALNPALDAVLKEAGQALIAYAEAHSADVLALAQSANQSAANVLLTLVQRGLNNEPALAPYVGFLVDGLKQVLPDVVVKAGGEEKVLWSAVIALAQAKVNEL